nr:hypothetical protein [uncultured Amphritea sp.]
MTDTFLLKSESSVFYGVRDKVAGIDGLEPVTDTFLLKSESSFFYWVLREGWALQDLNL